MEKLIQVTTPKGRVYKGSESGKLYPSVTTIVGILNEKSIDAWIKRVGEDKANEVKDRAASHGSRWHDLMEQYLTEQIPLKAQTKGEFWVASTLWINQIRPHISNITCVEKQFYSSAFLCAGTIDLVADWDGVPSIIDWKTTTHDKLAKDVPSYWCQLAAYAAMVREHLGYWPKQLVLVFNKSDQEFYYYTQPIPQWIKTFAKLREKFENSPKYKELKAYVEAME